jgi:glyoxylase-like metal-dependent hydrolase (beta-lactamase superfamily II)
MRKAVKIVLWIFGILVGILVISGAGFYISYKVATSKMKPAETLAVNDSVYSIKDSFVNAYLFKGKSSYLMVDAGFSKNTVAVELKKLGIAPERITTILLTHTDSDHTGAIGLFSQPKIYMLKEEEQMINGQTAKVEPFKTHWQYGPYILLNGSDTLTIDGLKIRMIPVPGHTPGSVCYVIGNDYLVTGDNLIVVNGKAEPFLDQFNMNTAQQIESLKALPDLKSFKYILTAHFGVTKN